MISQGFQETQHQIYSKSRPQIFSDLKGFPHKNTINLLLLGCLLSSAWDIRVFGGEKVRAESIEKVIIDAGHGGHDPGNLGTGKYRNSEKHIALEVALRAGQLIQKELRGVEVVYTRKSDRFLELRERTALANEEDADLFISVHCDAFTNGTPQGSSSYVMGKNHGDENMRVAQAENSVIFLEENYEENYEGFDPSRPETYIALTLYQNHFQYQSISLAQKMQNQFTQHAERRDRGVKQQPLYVTSRAAMPAVLIELGFLTNSKEEQFLNSDQGQQKMAESIFRAVRDYKREIDRLQSANKESTASKPLETEERSPIVFRVQVKTSSREMGVDHPFFKGEEEIMVHRSGAYFKYSIGAYANYDLARKEALRLRKSGFKGAFVVAYQNGERMDIAQARSSNR